MRFKILQGVLRTLTRYCGVGTTAAAWAPEKCFLLKTTMGSLTDGDLSKHLVIKTDVQIIFDKGKKSLLEVVFNGDSVNASTKNTKSEKHHCWTLDSEIRMFPNFGDTLEFRVKYGRWRCRNEESLPVYEYKNIAEKFKEHGQPILIRGTKFTMSLKVVEGSIDDV